MDWYDKLNDYFPAEEMKSKKHIDILLKEKGDIYHKDEGSNHVMIYAEFNDFTFVDYLWVSSKARGQGIGHLLLKKMKEKQKPILLEVEPIDYDDSDTEKRLRFYNRENFVHAQAIGYKPKSLETNKVNPMEILYWSPNNEETDQDIYNQVKMMYEKIHMYKAQEIYGKSKIEVDDVLMLDENRAINNLMKEVEMTE
ncbi:GNAT family N-acetyltransferase [Virgibacillus soli]|uniref:GNAT family N-acetyltransferase n=1 Tax=Paracerasibacillus soli TaxID=480284 RepID=A0ABU5CNF7_9BACI|nr:GNAT family N-acetyltransferase [Virgibacillus soli]MDY0407902.1 GNAT family N-acetyltransferase [Virgibacillus soli]